MAQKETQQHIKIDDVEKQIISNIDNGVLILDDNLVIHYYNRWLELHTGIKANKALGQRIDTLFKEIKTKTLIRKIKTTLKMNSPSFYTASTSKYLIPIKIDQIQTSSYTYMQQDVSIIPFDLEKRLVALIIIDQTVMANTNALLESNIKKTNELIDELIKDRDMIDKRISLIKLDKEANIIQASQAYLDLIGYDKEELLNINYFDFENINLDDELKDNIYSHMQNQSVHKFKHELLTKKEKKLWLDCTIVPEYDSLKNHIGYILFKENITASQQLILQQEKLLTNSKFSAMGEMIGMVAHQWRQPLSNISSTITNIMVMKELGTLDDKTVTDARNTVLDTIASLSTIIDDFSDFFAPDKELSEEFAYVIIAKSIQYLRDDFDTHKISFVQNIDKSIKLSTYNNELIQSLMNIFKNSLDAHIKSNNNNEKKIAVKISIDARFIYFTIIDNAGGIDKETMKKIFEPYFSTKSKNGAGLGLYMCKVIIEEHLCGTIDISSKKDKTKILIKLPLNM